MTDEEKVRVFGPPVIADPEDPAWALTPMGALARSFAIQHARKVAEEALAKARDQASSVEGGPVEGVRGAGEPQEGGGGEGPHDGFASGG